MNMWIFIKHHRSQTVLALVSAMLLTLSFPKTDQGWLAWVALVPLFLSLRQADWKSGMVIGGIFGLAHYLGVVYWTVHTMHLYGHLPLFQAVFVLVLLAGYLSIFPATVCGLLAWMRPRPGHMILCAPAVWVLLELIRGWLFSGFPWALLGYSQYNYLWLIQMSDLFGVFGLSALIVFCNAALTVILLGWLELAWMDVVPSRQMGTAAGVAAVCLLSTVIGYGIFRSKAIDRTASASPQEKIAVVQGNIDQAQKWDPRFQVLTTVKYRKLSLSPTVGEADLVIWPETATPFYFLDDKILSEMVIEGIKAKGSYFIIGSPSFSGDRENPVLHNSAYLISPRGEAQGRYDKVHLVPFGEYVPLKRWLPFIDKMVAQVGDFKPGPMGNTFSWKDNKVGMLICYESIFPALARAMVQNGATLLVNITNDAWFGRTSAAYQNLSMAVFRAVENRRWLARAANTGISGFVDPCGRILQQTELFEDAAVLEPVRLLGIRSVYSRWGDWPLGLLTLGVFSLYAGYRARYLNIVKREKF